MANYIAEVLWSPLLSLIYLEIGILLLFSSRFIVWKRAIPIFLTYINRRESDSKGKIISHRKAIFTSIGAQIGVGNIAGVATAVHFLYVDFCHVGHDI